MSFDQKERAIAAQNAATAAATLLGGTGDVAAFEQVRTAIFEGTLRLAVGQPPAQSVQQAVQDVQQAFPGAQLVQQGDGYYDSFPQDVPAPAPQGGGYGPPPQQSYADTTAGPNRDAGNTVVKFGKYSGQTIAQIFATDKGYGDFLADKTNNEFIKSRAQAYRASLG